MIVGKLSKTNESNKTKDQHLEVFCVVCKNETDHLVVQSFDTKLSELDEGFFAEVHYQIIQCQGCKTVSFRQNEWCSEWGGGGDELDDGTQTTLYPKRSNKIREIKTYFDAPNEVRRVYRETIECFNNELTTLCAAGLRAIIEGICADKRIADGPVQTEKDGTIQTVRKNNLEGKIAGLAEKGILTSKHAEMLHEHRFMGNEAVHELEAPSLDELTHAIEIIEHTLDALYEMPDKAEVLRRMQSRRKNMKSKKIKK